MEESGRCHPSEEGASTVVLINVYSVYSCVLNELLGGHSLRYLAALRSAEG